MLKIEIDGKQTEVQNGATVMDAANQLDIYVPHFCYHKKLSIAANCRMCLVQVEKAPKPMPACATPVTDGMKVQTNSDYAKKAQKGVMEFLLINHPLDCPICDQGGECQLQDLAVGYGKSASRYKEEKRVVFHKNIGPLVSMEEMTRCIHCTRCVRFGQEIAGVMELGMMGRGEHSEIVSFVGKTVDSELSGNMIDLCPVGALTSKPFRYSARTWELSRRKSVAPHDSLGSNLVVQVKQDKVMRVLPLENDELNECWLSDKDRFSYEGLNTDRLTQPMLKQGGAWREVDWQTALEYVANGLKDIKANHGAAAIGALSSPTATLEEMALLGKLVRGLGGDNIDFRLRQTDFSGDGRQAGVPWMGMSIAGIAALDRVLVVGSFLRKDHPLLANRLRQAAKRGTQINVIHATDDNLLMPVRNKAIVPPQDLPAVLGQVLKAALEAKGKAVPAAIANVQVSSDAKAIADSLVSGKCVALLLGNFAGQHPQAAQIWLLAQELSATLDCSFGFTGEAANTVGGHVAACVPSAGGLNASTMLAKPLRAYVMLGVEPALDCNDPVLAMTAIKGADMVVAMTAFRGQADEYADVLLPVAPFTETSGSFINAEGRLQSFNGVVRPLGETRPAWKVLRVLGNLLGLPGFDHDSSEAVRDECCKAADLPARLNNSLNGMALQVSAPAKGLQRIADVPIYSTDPLVRRAESLQHTADAAAPAARMSASQLTALGLTDGQQVRVGQGNGEVLLIARLDSSVPAGCVRVASAHALTACLGAMFGELSVVKA